MSNCDNNEQTRPIFAITEVTHGEIVRRVTSLESTVEEHEHELFDMRSKYMILDKTLENLNTTLQSLSESLAELKEKPVKRIDGATTVVITVIVTFLVTEILTRMFGGK